MIMFLIWIKLLWKLYLPFKKEAIGVSMLIETIGLLHVNAFLFFVFTILSQLNGNMFVRYPLFYNWDGLLRR